MPKKTQLDLHPQEKCILMVSNGPTLCQLPPTIHAKLVPPSVGWLNMQCRRNLCSSDLSSKTLICFSLYSQYIHLPNSKTNRSSSKMKGAKKLTKLKSALKKLPSSFTNRNNNDSTRGESEATGKLHPVYVGKSRRRYLVSSDVIEHPLFQVLVDKSNGGCEDGGGISVDCEVVLFDHLLWVLENADSYLVSVGELVEFYTTTTY